MLSLITASYFNLRSTLAVVKSRKNTNKKSKWASQYKTLSTTTYSKMYASRVKGGRIRTTYAHPRRTGERFLVLAPYLLNQL